jgi:uncharacterized protein YyaL (SSP411 family)
VAAHGGASPNDLQVRIREAIVQLADRIATVNLDERGMSRGDYSLLEGQWREYEPAWHTGQAILALVRAYESTGERRWLTAATRAGDWWVSLEATEPPALAGMVRAVHGAGIDAIVFATVSDGTPGLFRLYDVTKDERYARVPTRAGRWMLTHMYEPRSRMFYDAVDPATGEVLKTASPFWPDKPIQVLNDVARPNNEGSLFKDMFEYTGDPQYRAVFLAICDSLVEKQGPEGLWMDFTPNDRRDGTVHPRFNLWYAESLFDGYDLTRDERYLRAAVKTLRFYARLQDRDGGFHYGIKLDGAVDKASSSGSTTAFAGLLWLRARGYGAGTEFDASVERALQWVLTHRYPASHPDRALAGAVQEVRTVVKEGRPRVVQRDIADAFAVRFLCDYDGWLHRQLGRKDSR